jgi:hypothetical protein
MKILLASVGVPGHLNPLLAAGNYLIVVQTGANALRYALDRRNGCQLSLRGGRDMPPVRLSQRLRGARQSLTA